MELLPAALAIIAVIAVVIALRRAGSAQEAADATKEVAESAQISAQAATDTAFEWRRWWVPEGEDPPLDGSGMLEDPEAKYGRWLNPVARSLEMLAEVRLLTLIGDPGIGKSHEVGREVGRLKAAGELVAYLDLGSFATWRDLKDELFADPAVRQWCEDDTTELSLFLDGFDEATLAIDKLTDGLLRELSKLDSERLRLRVASRSVVWSRRLQEGMQGIWPDSNAVYVLAPLTPADVEVACDAAVPGDGEAFVREVRLRDVGALAARPVTLRLLLSIYSVGGTLPTSRIEVYSQGAEELASEHAERRLEEGDGDPPRDARLRAARHLAAVSLLSGSPNIARRVPEGGTPLGAVSLDEVTTDAVSLGELEAVWESALVVRSGDRRGTWTHRSVAEFLAASSLTSLSPRTVKHLLADPSDVDRVTPQLAGVAQWLSQTDADVLGWLAASEPELLLTPDLASRPPGERELIARALIDGLLATRAPTDRRSYHLLDYDGFADDLRPLLQDGQPSWVRREAIKMAADNMLRDFDTQLVELIENVATSKAPTDYDELVQLADYAAYGLTWCEDPALFDRLWDVVVAKEAPVALRVEVLKLVWGSVPLSEALSRIELTEPAVLSRRFAQAVSDGVGAAISTGEADPNAVLAWLCAHPEHVLSSGELEELASKVIVACIESSDRLDDALWSCIGALCAAEIRTGMDMFDWRRNGVEFPNPAARRRVVVETLLVRNEPADAWSLAGVGLLANEDFEYWLREYARLQGQGGPEEKVAEGAATALARPDESAEVVARRVAVNEPVIEELVDLWYSPERKAQYDASVAAQVEREARLAAERGQTLFSSDRAAAALEASDWPPLHDELMRQTAEDDDEKHSYVHGTSVSQRRSWSELTDAQRAAAEAAATEFLAAPPEVITHDAAEAAAGACALELDVRGCLPEGITPSVVKQWLPHVVELAGRFDEAAAMIQVTAVADPDWLDDYLVNRLAAEAQGKHVFLTDRLGSYTSERLELALLDHATEDQADPHVVGALITAALARNPDRAAEAALAIIRRRGDGRPILDPENGVFDLDDPQHLAWKRAVAAASSVAFSATAASVFDVLLNEFQHDPEFAADVIRSTDVANFRSPVFADLSPDQLASLYLWAHANLPRERWTAPGVTMSVNPVEEFAGSLIQRLRADPTEGDALALDRISAELGDAGEEDSALWIAAAAREAWKSVRESTWVPLRPEVVREILEVPASRAIATPEQLADVLLEAIDGLAEELLRDATLRSIFWQRQKGSSRRYIPNEENEFSDRIARILADRLRRVVIRREVQLQPGLGAQKGQTPDIEATVLLDDGSEISCLIEVKGNWHNEVETALTSQLGARYMMGPRGSSGVYLVAWYAGSSWDPDDYRLADSRRHTFDGLDRSLLAAADVLRAAGIDVKYRLLDLTLNQADLPAAVEEDVDEGVVGDGGGQDSSSGAGHLG